MKEYISREIYLNKIKPFINKDIIKVITGQRRVGKSYFLFQVIDLIMQENSANANIIYLNKELDEFSSIKNYSDLLNYIKGKKAKDKKNYVFIDEIQDIVEFEKALRSLQAESEYDIYCTGSNAKMLSGELATYLSGRYIELKIFSLSYSEFLTFHKLENTNKSFLQFIKYGGLPYLINLPLEDDVVYEYLNSIYNTIVLKDIVQRYNIRNLFILENLIRFIADNIGSIVSAKRISDFLKSQKLNYSPRIILEYLKYLEDVFVIFKVRRAEIGGRKIFEIGEKYYFEDLGLRNSVIRFNEKDYGKVLENLVYQQLIIKAYKVFIGKSGDKEIDFIGEKGDEKIYIQVAYKIYDEKTHKREFGNLLNIKDNFPKIVVSMNDDIEGNYKGIRHINIRDFLINEL